MHMYPTVLTFRFWQVCYSCCCTPCVPDNELTMSNTVAEVQLKRRFGLVQSISILTGFIIGTGIYLSPTYIMQMVAMPGLTLCMWVLAGCINTVAALTFAELGTTYPVIGDCYVYVDMFFGDFLAFMWLWKELFITRPGSNAVKALFAAA